MTPQKKMQKWGFVEQYDPSKGWGLLQPRTDYVLILVAPITSRALIHKHNTSFLSTNKGF